MAETIKVRRAVKTDVPAILDLVRELAEYEKASDQVVNTVERMTEDGFGDNPVFQALVAVTPDDQIVGTAIFYYRYSTWKGKRLYLEDIVVTDKERGKGIGVKLFQATIEAGKSNACTGMMWQVLDWNEPAINFYKKYETDFDNEWINCHIDF
jgi:GNAT superfamily N-acetyltransferase